MVDVSGALKGDRHALDRLLSSIRPAVVRYCRARIGRRAQSFAAADAIAAEILGAVLVALPAHRGKQIHSFVYDIASELVNKAAAAHPGRADVSPDSLVPWLLDDLPTVQREIIVLRVAVGLDAEQTALALGSTPGAIRVAQHRALTQLRKATCPTPTS
jgi:RNA polymerase sigma-70 factor (ECF subfamily)